MLLHRTLAAAGLLGLATLAQAEGWTFLPMFTDPEHRLAPSLALTVDAVDPKTDGLSTVTAVGLELSVNCGLLQSPDKRIRTALRLHQSDKDGLKATSLELSPRYMLPLGAGFSVGAGPSFSRVGLSGAQSKTLWGLGLSAGAEWRSGPWLAGADLRWHDLRRRDGVDYDHLALGVKAGIAF